MLAHKANSGIRKRKSQGFSLIEMAVVMLIMGSLLSGLLVALTQTSDSTRRTTATNQLLKIEEALYAFAQANGRLPCPAASDSDGFEDPVGGGNCNQPHGFVPSATLSLYGRINDDGLMLDPWANPYRYSIAPYEVDGSGFFVDLGTGTPAFSTQASLSALFNKDVSDGDNESGALLGLNDSGSTEESWEGFLRVCDAFDSCPNRDDPTYSSIVPAVILSMGSNWTDVGSGCPAATVTNDEEANAGTNLHNGTYCLTDTNTFVDAEYHEENFDDIVVWLSPYILFSRMISAAQLP